MPVTLFQRAVIQVLLAQRSPESHFAGSLPLHVVSESPRFSRDFDLFHDAEAELIRASEADEQALIGSGFQVQRTGLWSTAFRRARVGRLSEEESVEIDWAIDSAVRFFPVLKDETLGWRLHPFDLATNKALTLGARSETRDLVDIVEWSRHYPLSAIIWAACGKDPGFTPAMLLAMMRRFSRVNREELSVLAAREIDPVALKAAWIEAAGEAEEQMTKFAEVRPDLEIGVAFTDSTNNPRWPGDLTKSLESQGLHLHLPTVGGCLPRIRLA